MRRTLNCLILVSLVMILLTGCSLFGKKDGSVKITMLLKDGTPLQNVDITLVQGKTTLNATTSSDGSATVTAPAGEYTLSGSVDLFEGGKHNFSSNIVIEPSKEGSHNITEDKLGLATIKVINSANKKPITSSLVSIDKDDKNYTFKTGLTGTVSLYSKDATIKVKASIMGAESDLQEVVISSGKGQSIEVGLLATYTQDFSDNKLPADFLVVKDKWTVENERLVGNSPDASTQTSVVFGPIISDLVYSVDATFLSAVNTSRWFSIFFRAPENGEAPYHMFTIRHAATAANGTELAFRKPDGSWDVRRTKSFGEDLAIGKTYNIKVAVIGDTYLYFINDQLQFAAKETGYRSEGIFGFHVNGCQVAFDNIKIEPYDHTVYGKHAAKAN